MAWGQRDYQYKTNTLYGITPVFAKAYAKPKPRLSEMSNSNFCSKDLMSLLKCIFQRYILKHLFAYCLI